MLTIIDDEEHKRRKRLRNKKLYNSEKAKEKYSDELKELEDKIELNKRNTKLAKVIEFPLNSKKQ
ncbi:hypothetical protein [Sarcina ventriculi]|uniref:hypothetical protein n=1 Tax=Sarcina ventriculi TaxID=1267 RepID=UPI001C11C166|nr:hypothetical protein [Sarcina ventriculi]MBU5323631.1 hypothetical protein [Sarcina ventriculi]